MVSTYIITINVSEFVNLLNKHTHTHNKMSTCTEASVFHIIQHDTCYIDFKI